MIKKHLPIDNVIPDIVHYLKTNHTLILQATPGAGKTTRIPPCLLQVTNKNILVLEPRRIAARLSACRVAEELGEECGNTVGYQIRYEKRENKNTRIKFITEGLFLRFLLSKNSIDDIGCVVLDEFHERHIHTDVALMLVRLLQKSRRPDLKLVVMSATLETKSLGEYLPEAKVFICETAIHPVTLEYLDKDFAQKCLEVKVYDAVEKSLKKQKNNLGHILIFLPGRFEIARCTNSLKDLKNKYQFEIYTLSADTTYAEQQKIFEETTFQKIILATNVAETSITIEGVTTVIDSGLAKIAGHASWNGLSTLNLRSISQSSSIQRAGRAGRTRPGKAIRLFTQYDYNLRPQFEIPEIQRVDLTQILLEIKSTNICNQSFLELPWFEKPAANVTESCAKLLYYLNAFDENYEITATGRNFANFSLHPRLSRILIEGKERLLFPQSLLLVSLLSEGSIFKKDSERQHYSHSDIEYQLNIIRNFQAKTDRIQEISKINFNDIDKNQLNKVILFLKNLCQSNNVALNDCLASLSEQNLSLLLLSGYPDRVCKARNNEKESKKNTHQEYNLCLGGGAILSKSSTVVEEEFILAIEAEESLHKHQYNSTQIRIAHGIDKNLLAKAHPSFITKTEGIFWNSEKETAIYANQFYYGKIIVKENFSQEFNSAQEELLLSELKKAWPRPFENDNSILYFNNKLTLIQNYGINVNLLQIKGEEFELFLSYICEGKRSFSEIAEKKLEEYLQEYLDYSELQKLNTLLPNQITVGKGRKILVHYEEDKPPFVSSRLQDFFGTLSTPKILNNQLSLVVHLLAPNMQSVQVTTDLAGFWERGYVEIRKELSRRYPRHSWPENPKTAEPPEIFRKKI